MDLYPKAVLVKEIYDVRSWIAPNLNELHGHSQPHCLTEMYQAKQWCLIEIGLQTNGVL